MAPSDLHTADVYVESRDETLEGWVAYGGEAVGIGASRADALRSLASDLDRRELLAASGVPLHDEDLTEAVREQVDADEGQPDVQPIDPDEYDDDRALVLALVRANGELPQKVIHEHVPVSRAKVSLVLKGLERDGLVEREWMPGNLRAKVVRLSGGASNDATDDEPEWVYMVTGTHGAIHYREDCQYLLQSEKDPLRKPRDVMEPHKDKCGRCWPEDELDDEAAPEDEDDVGPGETVAIDESLPDDEPTTDLDGLLDPDDPEALRRAYEDADGDVAETARRFPLGRTAIHQRLVAHGIVEQPGTPDADDDPRSVDLTQDELPGHTMSGGKPPDADDPEDRPDVEPLDLSAYGESGQTVTPEMVVDALDGAQALYQVKRDLRLADREVEDICRRVGLLATLRNGSGRLDRPTVERRVREAVSA